MKKILFLTYRYPFKNGPHCSFGQNIFYEALKKHYDVKGICFGNKDKDDDLFVSFKINTNFLKKIINLLFRIPFRLTYYYSKMLKVEFENLLVTFKPDIIYVEHTVMMQYIKNKYPSIRIFFYDDESMIYAKGNKLIKSFKERVKNIFMVAAEKKALSMADLTFTITEHEKNYLKKLNFRDDVKSLSYGIDTNYFYLNWKPPEGKTKILFLGNYNHFPNVEAIKFISEKLSTKFMKDDQVELIIVGRNAEKIKKYIKPNFRVYENVKDVREFYWNSTIFIAPIFYGGGLRTKILEAAACGVPIVMSTLANNGFNFNNNDDVLIADEEEEYIEIIGRIISRNNFDLQKLSNNANKKIKEQFSSEVVTTKLLKYII